METFYTQVRIEHFAQRDRSVTVEQALVDSGSEYTWIDGGLLESIGVQREKKDLTFTMANGQTITRSMGFAIVRSGEFFTVDEVVFAQPGDLQLLGARSLEGFNARVDSQRKRLVAAGPIPAAVAEGRPSPMVWKKTVDFGSTQLNGCAQMRAHTASALPRGSG